MTTTKHGFLFDMDGVIVDSNPFHKIALVEFCREHGHNLSDQELREKIYGRTNKDWIMNVFGDVEPATIRQYTEEKEALYRKVHGNAVTPLRGLITFLHKMDKAGILRAVATSAPRANVDFLLSGTGTEKYFPTILDDSFVTIGKPNPEIYLKAAAALGLKPQDCVVFEDSLSGVAAGKTAGCKVVGVMTTHTQEELHETDLNILDFENLDPESLISRLFYQKT